MYRCNNCGYMKSSWCDVCKKALKCDHSETDQARFKDLIYDCDDGEMTVTIWLSFCKTCGKMDKVYR